MRTWVAERVHDVIVMAGGLLETPRFDSTRRRDRVHLWVLRTARKVRRRRPQPGDTVWVRLEEVAYGLVVRDEVMPFWVGHDSLHLSAVDPDGVTRHLLLRMYPRDPQQHGYPRAERPAPVMVGAAEIN